MEFDSVSNSQIRHAITLMNNFAVRTGLDSDQPVRRYLWTDAFAVCNYLGLAHSTGDRRFRNLALRLVDQVHHNLGRHRQDDPRHGWISGLAEGEGEAHPTRGGLRIGKPLTERGARDPFDERLEWDRDGQYFHYLTKWMHALDQLSRATGESRYNLWARELAATAHDAFVEPPASGQPTRMYWKMSIDLSHPLVSSMGQHDPLDGYITALQLQTTAARLQASSSAPDLTESIHQYETMANQTRWASPDPLGIGGLLIDAYRATQLKRLGAPTDAQLVAKLLGAALAGLRYYVANGEMQAPAEYRLAFRELGLAIGLEATERLSQEVGQKSTTEEQEVRHELKALSHYFPLGRQIREFWLDPAHRQAQTWSEHQDINEVMLATSLVLDGFLELRMME
ncbi:MAG: hypothetical protein P8103_07945 [Candidatus Thiodiazotropha sp.]